jgi:hypothetical protein
MRIPQDPFILLSYVNTKLRDDYSSLEELCSNLDIDKQLLETSLSAIEYTYESKSNRFMPLM